MIRKYMGIQERREIEQAKLNAFSALPITSDTPNKVIQALMSYWALTIGDDSEQEFVPVVAKDKTEDELIELYNREFKHLRPKLFKDKGGKLKVTGVI